MVLFIGLAIAFMCAHLGSALDNGAARTPPMGFNSYMSGLSGASSLGAIADFFISSGLQARGVSGWEKRGITWRHLDPSLPPWQRHKLSPNADTSLPAAPISPCRNMTNTNPPFC